MVSKSNCRPRGLLCERGSKCGAESQDARQRTSPALGARLGRPRKIGEEDAEALFEELIRGGSKYQDEIAYWLWIERGVKVDRSTVSRFLRENNWSRRTL